MVDAWFPVYDYKGKRSLSRGDLIAWELPCGTWQTATAYNAMREKEDNDGQDS